jgi:hypothetical protein
LWEIHAFVGLGGLPQAKRFAAGRKKTIFAYLCNIWKSLLFERSEF